MVINLKQLCADRYAHKTLRKIDGEWILVGKYGTIQMYEDDNQTYSDGYLDFWIHNPEDLSQLLPKKVLNWIIKKVGEDRFRVIADEAHGIFPLEELEELAKLIKVPLRSRLRGRSFQTLKEEVVG